MAKNNKFYVERETYEKNEKTYFAYFIKGTIRGKEVKISIVPPDRDLKGYMALDIVFGDENKAELVVNPFEIKDDATGKVIKGNTYIARTTDAHGEVYECNIRPFKNSDKTLLNMIIK